MEALGIRNLEIQSKASDSHLIWRLISNQNSQWVCIITKKCILKISWKNIIKHREIILDKPHPVVGRGDRINTLQDCWVPSLLALINYPLRDASNLNQVPKFFEDRDNRSFIWNKDKTQKVRGGKKLYLYQLYSNRRPGCSLQG